MSGTVGGPLSTTTTINGYTKTVLRFDGESTLLGAPLTGPASGSVFLVFNNAGGGSNERVVFGWEEHQTTYNGVSVVPANVDSQAYVSFRQQPENAADCWLPMPGVGSTWEIWGFTWGPSGTNVYRKIGDGPGSGLSALPTRLARPSPPR